MVMRRRIQRSFRPWWFRFGVLLTVITLGWLAEVFVTQESPLTNQNRTFQAGEYKVLRVVDGDTLVLVQDGIRVRLQGIDTPETVKEDTPVEPWGPEAADYVRRFVNGAGSRVYLSVSGQRIDRYGRQLAFVWHQGRCLNEELVAAGLAKAQLHYDYSNELKSRLRLAEEEARRQERGIWSQSP